MYINQVTLFVAIELVVVYVVITVFMFYRSRLYHLLVAILKEMRWERLRRQQEKQQEVAELRAQNKKLTDDYQNARQTADSAGKTLPDQLRDRVEELVKKSREQGINLKRPPEDDDEYQLEWLRCRTLELERQLLEGNIDQSQWQALSQTALKDSGLDGSRGRHRTSAEEETHIAQLERDASQYMKQFETAKERITFLENELTDLRSINTESSSHFERPQKGMYADEIYRHKCEKYDMQENINNLKLKLQQMDPNGDNYQQNQEALIRDLEQYIKEADVTLNLLEKELEAVNHENNELEAEIHKLKNRLKDIATGSDEPAIDRKNVKKLTNNTSKQAQSVATLRDSIEQLRQGENQERMLDVQESEVARLELLVRDSESCVKVLEMELEHAQDSINQLSSREQELLERLKLLEVTPEGPLPTQLNKLNDHQKNSLDQLRRQIDTIRDGGDALTVIKQQEEEIDRLERLLVETGALITKLDSTAGEEEDSARERPDSNEDLEEMESLLQQFMVDSQSMLNRLKELEDENQQLKESADLAKQ